MASLLNSRFVHHVLSAALPLALAGVLLGIAPFAVALEVHHELAAADDDGHRHSDSDLCQWVQHHTGSSLLADAPVLQAGDVPIAWAHPVSLVLLSSDSHGSASPRAPPRS